MVSKFKPRKLRFKSKSVKGGVAKLSKPMVKAIKSISKQQAIKEAETKTINVPQSGQTSVNTVNLAYPALSGLQYLVSDIFSVKQGVNDSTLVLPYNRIGDRIRGVGFLMDYYFTLSKPYSLSSVFYIIPFVKLRVTVWRQAFGVPVIPANLLYDTNFLTANSSTLQPINWNEGYVKEVLYDKVHIIRNNLSYMSAAGTNSTNNTVPPALGQVFHFKKYMKYDKLIKFTDNNTVSPNSTDSPINITISAEIDDSVTGMVPSGSTIMQTTGYTRAWFKDA